VKQAVHIALALTAFTAVGASRPVQDDAGLSLTVVRSYRPASSQTVIDVFCRIPLLLVNPIGNTGGGDYRFAVSVKDSSGQELISQSWVTPVRADLMRTRGASTAERMTFGARPGRYDVTVSVTDSASGRVTRSESDVVAFGGNPGGSDLLLASDVREAAGPEDTVARGSEVRRGPLYFLTSGTPVLTPQASKLAYYLELYPAHAESVQVRARVLSESGSQVVAAPPVPVTIGEGGGFTHGVVDLAGLPAGQYRFEVAATGPDSTITRSAPFGMTGFEAVAQAQAVIESSEWPAGLTEAQMDSAYEPLIYLMSGEEQGVYSSLSVEGKRKWLRQFWTRRDPTPGTTRNEERDRFYAAIAEADRQFREGGASAIPGWRTDRGRIYIKYGAPDEVLERHVQQGTSPYEIWKYTRKRSLKYVFMDLTRFGNYRLIYTDDRREPSRPDWQDLLGPDGLKDLQQN
jgi:GWxTD domain-containing protein